jgi:uncharacterized protein
VSSVRLALSVLIDKYAVCRLDAASAVPGWAFTGPFSSVTRTPDELSVVCPQDAVPSGIQSEKDWRCMAVDGPLGFTLVGVLESLLEPLAAAQISIFVISTYDTDYLMVNERNLEQAVHTLSRAGHLVSRH